jgi:hypothetical protein
VRIITAEVARKVLPSRKYGSLPARWPAGGPFQRRFAGLPQGEKGRKVHSLEMRKITMRRPLEKGHRSVLTEPAFRE